MENSINERIKSVVKREGLTMAAFAERVGVPLSTIKTMFQRGSDPSVDFLRKVSNEFSKYSLDWLVTGGGNVLKLPVDHSTPLKEYRRGESLAFEAHDPRAPYGYKKVSKLPERVIDEQQIPLYDLDAAAGLRMLLSNKDQNVIDHIKIPYITKCDGAVFVTGDSMYPLLKSGDVALFKQVKNLEYLIYGDMYIVSYEIDGDEHLVVKYVQKSEREGHIKLVSYNQHYEPIEIPVYSINAIAIVQASIRYNNM